MTEAAEQHLLQDLNEAQRSAVLAHEGPLLVLAGAGSGKTRVITTKIAWLCEIQGYAPWEILAVTFTNKAAGEMRERCRTHLGASAEELWLGTFHRIGVKLLRRHAELIGRNPSFVIYDADDQKAMVKRVMESLSLSPKTWPVQRFIAFINQAKQQCQGPEDPNLPSRGDFHDRCAEVYKCYEEAMLDSGSVDFGDLIYLPWRLMDEHPLIASEYRQRWRYVLVDEFQDTNRAQYLLLKAILNDSQNICAVGDDDQSIYRWRGADVEHILGFDSDFPNAKVIRLEQNYRSSDLILQVAESLISRNARRRGKTLWTERKNGEKVRVAELGSDREEAEYVARRIETLSGRFRRPEMAIFYRTNAQSRSFEDVLRRRRVPYKLVGGLKFYERAEVKNVLAYLKVVHNPRDVVGFERIINRPTRGIGKGTLGQIKTHAEQRSCSLWEATRDLAITGRRGLQKKLQPFVSLIAELQELADEGSAYEVANAVLSKTKYLDRLAAEDTVESEVRADNIRELLTAIDEHGQATGDVSLNGYLEQVALVSALDQASTDDDAVVLMTAHNAKGLEFDVVFVTGLEEGLLPHANSSDSRDGVEEERRLAYVAMTRARHILHLTHAQSRRRYGDSPQLTDPSRFLHDLPSACLQKEGSPRVHGHAGLSHHNRWTRAQPASRRSHTQTMPSYEDYSQDPQTLGPGGGVFHPQYGDGVVVKLSGSGTSTIVHVRFNGETKVRRIIARFLTPN